jgi:hypothetical protein
LAITKQHRELYIVPHTAISFLRRELLNLKKMEPLKELVIQTLDANGILDSIRGQLRQNVFKAIESQEN